MADYAFDLQVYAEMDDRTCITCLRAAGQVRPPGIAFRTDSGDYEVPPFHVHCRCMVIPHMEGFYEASIREANGLIKQLTPSQLVPPPGLDIVDRQGHYVEPPPPPAWELPRSVEGFLDWLNVVGASQALQRSVVRGFLGSDPRAGAMPAGLRAGLRAFTGA